MIRCVICEDDAGDLKALRRTVEAAARQMELEVMITSFNRQETMLESVRSGDRYDLLMMKVSTKPVNGIDTAREAQALMPGLQLAFVSREKEWAAEAFELHALHYLMKPVSEESMGEVLARYMMRTGNPITMLTLQAKTRSFSLPLHRVQKIISSRKGVDIYLEGENAPRHFNVSFMKVEEQLDDRVFIKISRGLIVKMSFIQKIERGVCRFKDGTEALLSRSNRESICKRYGEYMFAGGGTVWKSIRNGCQILLLCLALMI